MWRAPEGPEGLAAVPVGGGGAWPGFETTRRAKLAARTARGHTKSPAPRPGHSAPGTAARDKRADRDPAVRKVAAKRTGDSLAGRGSVTERVEIE